MLIGPSAVGRKFANAALRPHRMCRLPRTMKFMSGVRLAQTVITSVLPAQHSSDFIVVATAVSHAATVAGYETTALGYIAKNYPSCLANICNLPFERCRWHEVCRRATIGRRSAHLAPSSSGLGYQVFILKTGVRFPLGLLLTPGYARCLVLA